MFWSTLSTFFSTCFVSVFSFCHAYFQGFTTKEILARRLDNIQTTAFTILLLSGFKPVFIFLLNCLLFVKNLFLGLFFPKQKLNNLANAYAQLEVKKQKLLKKEAALEIKEKELTAQIEKQQKKVHLREIKRAYRQNPTQLERNPINE